MTGSQAISNYISLSFFDDEQASNVIIGNQLPNMMSVMHDFGITHSFFDLKERKDIAETVNPPSREAVLQIDNAVDMSVEYQTTATIKFVENNAGYKNTVGSYTIAADGTIQNAAIHFVNSHDSIGKSVDVNLASESTTLGLFLIANGYNQNQQFKKIDLDNATIEFVFDLNKKTERAAKITDNAKDVTLVVHSDGKTIKIKGDIYHSDLGGQHAQINADGKEHAISGLADPDDPSTLRVGFEDLKNLGDADFNDAIIDITIAKTEVETDPGSIHGGDGNQVIVGTDNDDDITGGGGHDIIDGGLGNDILAGSHGNDTIYGGLGNDSLNGGEGRDILHGNEGDDTLDGYGGEDTLHGGDGNDTLNGGDENDTLYGDDGNDFLNGNKGNDIIHGGAGIDTISGGEGNDTVYGDDGNDIINGNAGDDILNGGAGDDELRGSDGNDTLNGDGGSDTLYGGAGNDIIIGGDGYDRLYGNEGADTFVFLSESAFNDRDQIYDFNIAEGDSIDITDLLSNYDPLTDAITDFVKFGSNGTHSYLKVNVDGTGNAADFANVAQITRVTGLDDVEQLIADGTLKI